MAGAPGQMELYCRPGFRRVAQYERALRLFMLRNPARQVADTKAGDLCRDLGFDAGDDRAAVPRAGRRFVRTACASCRPARSRGAGGSRRQGMGSGYRASGWSGRSRNRRRPHPSATCQVRRRRHVARRADDQVGAPVEQGVPAARQDFSGESDFGVVTAGVESGDHREQALGGNQRIDGDAQFGPSRWRPGVFVARDGRRLRAGASAIEQAAAGLGEYGAVPGVRTTDARAGIRPWRWRA